MKTILFTSNKTTQIGFIAILSLLIHSCGSYQNSSYYDTDGVYGGGVAQNNQRQSQNNNGDEYKLYFQSLQDNSSSDEIFTDVESYSNFDPNDSIQAPISGNAAWGSNPQTTSIYINNNGWDNGFWPGWGWGMSGWYGGWGWNNPWGWNAGWGLGWGWGYPGSSWGLPGTGWWGYPGGYWGPNYRGYDYAFNSSRRGSRTDNGVYSTGRYSRGNAVANSNYNRRDVNASNGYNGNFNRRGSSSVNRNGNNGGYQTSANFTRRNNTNSSSNSSYTTYSNDRNSRQNTNSNYYPDRSSRATQSSTPSSRSNSSYSPSRSYTPSSSSSGGRSSSGGGGSSRSSGGVGRGGRG